MFLSKLEIPIIDIANPYNRHKVLWNMFPKNCNAKREFLFRVDNKIKNAKIEIIMQSIIRPDEKARNVKLTKEFNPVFKNSSCFRFLLCANPCKMKNKNRVPYIHEQEQIKWLKNKFEGIANINACNVIHKEVLFFKKNDGNGKIFTVTFQGILIIKDSDLFLKLFQTGIGPAKSFGCGMLSLMKI
ncbi:MAG: type I-E CRISPR-associated protein Cas6/Cse3/CasE [Endomicrobium sp.]|jgi:CRISPR system Cascade subunit CasE|nr:type I-E CRISPR-associated protein Cas6/Cse3/CasE [Endomicrobium sp.]